MRIDARVNACDGWVVFRGDTSERLKSVVYVDDATNEFGYYGDPPRTTLTEVLIEHQVAKRIAIHTDTKVVRIWE